MAFDLEQNRTQSNSIGITAAKTPLEKLLTSLAEARQAKLTAEGMRVYVNSLLRYDFTDVREAVVELGNTPRLPGETAFPALGNILTLVRKHAQRRSVAETPGYCHACASGAHPGYQPVYGSHISRVTGKQTSIAVAVRPCECRHKTKGTN